MSPTNLLGPDGASRRLEELQRRIDAYSAPSAPESAPGTPSFGETLGGMMPADPMAMNVAPTGDLSGLAAAAAKKHGVDPGVFQALVQTESSWNPMATSRKGALGLTQLMPGTAAGLGVTDPHDPSQNLEAGAKYLKQMLDRFGNDYPKALAAYNAGPHAVEKANGVPPYHETISYVRKILGAARIGGS